MSLEKMNDFNSEDYYLNSEGLMVFTEQHHLKRGYCCNSGCKHCPYKNDANQLKAESNE
tara:strand:+ start:2971 stop:3147 length:177 start_codon:yes stop_codon:yes gene_type:complete